MYVCIYIYIYIYISFFLFILFVFQIGAFFFFPAKIFIVSIWSKAWERAPGWLKSCLVAAERAFRKSSDARGVPQRPLNFGDSYSCLRVSLLKRYSPSPACGPASLRRLVRWSPIFLMSFTCSSRKRLSRKSQTWESVRTQGSQIQKRLVQVLLPENGGFYSVLGFTPLILRRLPHVLEKGAAPALVLHFQETLGALALFLGQFLKKVAHAVQSHIVAVEIGAQREVSARPADAC